MIIIAINRLSETAIFRVCLTFQKFLILNIKCLERFSNTHNLVLALHWSYAAFLVSVFVHFFYGGVKTFMSRNYIQNEH